MLIKSRLWLISHLDRHPVLVTSENMIPCDNIGNEKSDFHLSIA